MYSKGVVRSLRLMTKLLSTTYPETGSEHDSDSEIDSDKM